ncbi:MAG: hypothetical protein Fur0046_15330 [Cyanobacteria bacterium J069]
MLARVLVLHANKLFKRMILNFDFAVALVRLGELRRDIMLSNGRIPLWVVATIAGLGVIAVVGLFFYGAYAGIGSSI